MDAENQLFIYRVGQLPMVKAACERAISIYGATKGYNSLLNMTLQMAENSVKYASETEAVKKTLQSPLVTVANDIAVGQLEKLEEKYPSIKMTPDELWNVSKEYYEHSRIKGGVDKVYSTKDYGVAKMDETKQFCQSFLNGEIPPVQVVYELMRRSLLALNGVLDYSDAFIDRYVAVSNPENPLRLDSGECSLTDRVQFMSGKAYSGIKYQATAKYGETKAYIIQTLGDLQMAMILMEHAKNAASWANGKASETLSAAQGQASQLWQEIQRRSAPLGKQAETVLLHLVQGLASSLASVSDQIVKYSKPYLPSTAEDKLIAAAGYANELRDTFAKAGTLGDLRDELIVEAKQKIGYVQDGLINAIDYFSDFPPVSWLAMGFDGLDLSDEEMLNINRDVRRPGSPRLILPIIEPRSDNQVHSG